MPLFKGNDIDVVITGLQEDRTKEYIDDATVHVSYVDPATEVAITNATDTNPVVITAPGHTFTNGMKVAAWYVDGNTAVNGVHEITNVDGDTFELVGVAGDGLFDAGGARIAACVPEAESLPADYQAATNGNYYAVVDRYTPFKLRSTYKRIVFCVEYGFQTVTLTPCVERT